MPDPSAPEPAEFDGRSVVPIDVHKIAARMRFDVATRTATVEVTVDFDLDGQEGLVAFDLRQDVGKARINEADVLSSSFSHRDVGAGWDARMRVLDRYLDPTRKHRMEMSYELGTPDATNAHPIDWVDGGVRFDFFMSDLEAGRYLEMWLPSGLCHDRMALTVDIEITGTDRPHSVICNGTIIQRRPDCSWRVAYPETYTSLSPMLVISPSDEVSERSAVAATAMGKIDIHCWSLADTKVDLDAALADVTSWISYLSSRYGPWPHAPRFDAVIWESGRGMEYDGATTSSVAALEHEVFHSWFGRGVKPASANDGWIDEAWTTWATISSQLNNRFAAEELSLDEPTVMLYHPHPWSRRTLRSSYVQGARLFSGIAHLLGGAPSMRSAMASWYKANNGGLITTAGLEEHLSREAGRDLSPWFNRYVRGWS